MNDWDKNNLEFLLSLKSKAEWDDWAESCDEDDFLYAMELVKAAATEVAVMAMSRMEELESTNMDLTDANLVLNKFRLGVDN